MPIKQLTLPIQVRDNVSFDNFYPGSNVQILNQLEIMSQGAGERFIYLWGQSGTGCSHLLQACCKAAREKSFTAAYIPLSNDTSLQPELLEGLENFDLVCLDNMQNIAGHSSWEEAIFHCYNRIQSAGSRLLMAAAKPPNLLTIQLKDLKSRLCSTLIFQVQRLSDQEKFAALQLRARQRGLILPQDVGDYILRCCSRDLNYLIDLLQRIDEASLAAQRKITIPFLKTVLNGP